MEQTSLFSEKGMKKKGGKKKKKEESLQIFLAKYMRLKYPDVIFQSDIASGIRLTIGQAVKAAAMRSGRGQPDLIIMEPKHSKREYQGDIGPATMYSTYCGLCIELKNELSDVYLKDGKTISDSKSMLHVREQAAMLERLRRKGYFSCFGFGRTDCMRIIDEYMAL